MKGIILKDKARGFTLVEVMITLVIAMIILAGLLLNFMSQSKTYKFINKKVDASQDLEFAMKFIGNDLKSALVSINAPLVSTGTDALTVSFDGVGIGGNSSYLSFVIWDATASAPDFRTRRCYVYDNASSGSWMVKFKRSAAINGGCVSGTSVSSTGALIGEDNSAKSGLKVTQFRVFQDRDFQGNELDFSGNTLPANQGRNDPVTTLQIDNKGIYNGMPKALQNKVVMDSNNQPYSMPAFTILMEVEVDKPMINDAKDVLGATVVKGRRIWRYIQIYPNTVVAQ